MSSTLFILLLANKKKEFSMVTNHCWYQYTTMTYYSFTWRILAQTFQPLSKFISICVDKFVCDVNNNNVHKIFSYQYISNIIRLLREPSVVLCFYPLMQKGCYKFDAIVCLWHSSRMVGPTSIQFFFSLKVIFLFVASEVVNHITYHKKSVTIW